MVDHVMDRLVLQRDVFRMGHPTTGSFYLVQGNERRTLCRTIELPWMNNQRGSSCIPAGAYRGVWAMSPRLGKMTWRLVGVPKRDGILIHPANYISQLRGCIAPGVTLKDINGDGLIDAVSSGKATADLQAALEPYQSLGIDVIVLNA